MNQFTFTGKLRTYTLAMVAIGLISLVIGLTGDSSGARIWSNVLHNSIFFLGISFMLLFLLCAKSLAYSGWQTTFKRMWEAAIMFIPVGVVLMLIVGLGAALGWHHLYHWTDAEAFDPNSPKYDEIMAGKAAFLNLKWYIGGAILFGAYWTVTAFLYRRWSLAEDTEGGLGTYRKTKLLSAFFLPIGGVSAILMIFVWQMSVDAHWYSTLYGWYCLASWFVAAIALSILLLMFLKTQGYFQNVTDEHFHDLGKFMFGFSVFWAYLWFSQYMLIWYANVGEETVYFQTRINKYPFLFGANLVLNFVLPFLVLMRNSTKRKWGTLIFVAVFVFLGHWMDYFLMIKPGVWETQTHLSHSHDDHSGDHGESTTHLNDHSKGDHSGEAHSDDDHGDTAHADASHGDGYGGHSKAKIPTGFQIPGFVDFGMMIGFLGLWLIVFFTALSRAALTPVNDPYLQESLHHHTGFYDGSGHH
ncbi:MAG: hypothetical protein AAF502_05905 [Bacteroidota bacterium]